MTATDREYGALRVTAVRYRRRQLRETEVPRPERKAFTSGRTASGWIWILFFFRDGFSDIWNLFQGSVAPGLLKRVDYNRKK